MQLRVHLNVLIDFTKRTNVNINNGLSNQKYRPTGLGIIIRKLVATADRNVRLCGINPLNPSGNYIPPALTVCNSKFCLRSVFIGFV
jgi:hypothetical protein